MKEARALRRWAKGTREVRDPLDQRRLRLAFQVADMLAASFPPSPQCC